MKKTGGPAFPVTLEHFKGFENKPLLGVTVRDYFAASAMQGMLAKSSNHSMEFLVREAFKAADQMIEEREK